MIGLGIGFFGLMGEMSSKESEILETDVLYPPLDVPESLDRIRVPDGILPRTTEAFGGGASSGEEEQHWRSPWYDKSELEESLGLSERRVSGLEGRGKPRAEDVLAQVEGDEQSDANFSEKTVPESGTGDSGKANDLNDLFAEILGEDDSVGKVDKTPTEVSVEPTPRDATVEAGDSQKISSKKPVKEIPSAKNEGAIQNQGGRLLAIDSEYDHPFLRSLLSVLSNEPRLKAAMLQIKIEDARARQSRGALLPTLDLVGTVESRHEKSRSTFQDSTHPAELGLVMTQPIYHRDSMLNYRTSKVRKEEIVYQNEEQRQEVIADLCARYLDIHRFKVLADYSRNNAGLSDQHYRSTKIRFEKGELTKTDVHQAIVRHKTALAVKDESYSQVEIARRRLEELTREVAPEDVPFFSLEITPQYLESIQAQGGTRLRPDLKVLEQQVEQERLRGAVARSRHLPKLDLTLEQTRSWVDDAGTTPNPLDETRVALDLQWNLLNGTSSFHEVSERDLRTEQLRLKLLYQKREAERLISEGVYKVGITQKLVDNYGEAVKAAAKALLGIQEEFLVGTRTSLDAFDAQSELFISQTRWINAKVDHLLAEVALLKASGHLRFDVLASILTEDMKSDAR